MKFDFSGPESDNQKIIQLLEDILNELKIISGSGELELLAETEEDRPE